MNKSNFNQTLGYPLTTERLQELQTSYWILNALGMLAGNYTIISGCAVEGSYIGDGVIFLNGELFEFKKSALTANSTVIIVDEQIIKSFKNGALKEVHTIRYTRFGSSPNSWAWSSFTRPIETKAIKDLLNGKANQSDITRLDNLKTNVSSTNELAERVRILEGKISTAPPPPQIFAVSGTSYMDNLQLGDQSNNYGSNNLHLYPPAGYQMSHLMGFIPSIAGIYFDGDVDRSDNLWCRWQKMATRIEVICGASEQQTGNKRAVVNYFALWGK